MTGTIDDWKKVREKAARLEAFDLSWWTKELLPVLDEFVNAAEGKPNRKFFKSIVNLRGGSGVRSPLSGWIQALFPYLLSGRDFDPSSIKRNTYLGAWRQAYENDCVDDLGLGSRGRGCGPGVKLERIPSGISSAPFILSDVRTSTTYPMAFQGGLVSVCQDPKTGAIEPQFGWAVIEQE